MTTKPSEHIRLLAAGDLLEHVYVPGRFALVTDVEHSKHGNGSASLHVTRIHVYDLSVSAMLHYSFFGGTLPECLSSCYVSFQKIN